jgi:hypothetical protein
VLVPRESCAIITEIFVKTKRKIRRVRIRNGLAKGKRQKGDHKFMKTDKRIHSSICQSQNHSAFMEQARRTEERRKNIKTRAQRNCNLLTGDDSLSAAYWLAAGSRPNC